MQNENVRNIAIIAHVDHGKTTLVDALFRQSGLFRDNQEVEDRVMDSGELERERGITISAKNCSVMWNNTKINILDTPGHADFGGEVERALSMVDGAVLLVDASEGPLPQTRFVLGKALHQGKPIIVVVNKIDRPDARVEEVVNEVYDLFIDLDADEDQLEFPLMYAVGRDGVAGPEPERATMESLTPLFDTIVSHLPAPTFDENEPFQMLVADLGYSDFLGRLAIGRIAHGTARAGDQLVCINEAGEHKSLRVSKLQVYAGLTLAEAERAEPGDILVVSGLEEAHIGDTITTKEAPRALPRISVDEPTVSMRFAINTSPLAGTEGKIVQGGKIRERLIKEALNNVSITVTDGEDRDSYVVAGRGEFQMAIIAETMRREGYEFTIGRPRVIMKEENGKTMEPMEQLFIDCDEHFTGVITEKLSQRKGRMTNLVNHGSGRVRLEFAIPSRGLIGYRDEFLTDTKGTGIMNSLFGGWTEYMGEIPSRFTGSVVSDRSGKAVAYALFNLEPRGTMFVVPGDAVYEGMVVGEHNRTDDIEVNPTKEKKLTNMRASGKDESIILTPVLPMTLERAIHYIGDDECVEVTPENIRIRKTELSSQKRHSMGRKKK